MTAARDLEGQAAPAATLAIKAVPGASRDEIAGWLGDRLKIRVAAPAEGGRANRAVCAVVAGSLGLRPAAVSVVSGATRPEKTLRLEGLTAAEVLSRLGR